jgi:hypothetical protein
MLNTILLNATTPDDVFSETDDKGIITFTAEIPVKIGNVASLKAIYKTKLGELKPTTTYTMFGILKVDPTPTIEIKWLDDHSNPTKEAMLLAVGTVKNLKEVTTDNDSFTSASLACRGDEKDAETGYYKTTWVGSTIPKGLAPYVNKDTVLAVYGRAKLHNSGDKTYVDVSSIQTKIVSKGDDSNGGARTEGRTTVKETPVVPKAPPNPLF